MPTSAVTPVGATVMSSCPYPDSREIPRSWKIRSDVLMLARPTISSSPKVLTIICPPEELLLPRVSPLLRAE